MQKSPEDEIKNFQMKRREYARALCPIFFSVQVMFLLFLEVGRQFSRKLILMLEKSEMWKVGDKELTLAQVLQNKNTFLLCSAAKP